MLGITLATDLWHLLGGLWGLAVVAAALATLR